MGASLTKGVSLGRSDSVLSCIGETTCTNSEPHGADADEAVCSVAVTEMVSNKMSDPCETGLVGSQCGVFSCAKAPCALLQAPSPTG